MSGPSPRYDLIVIGAGINGAAIAREAALSGLAVLVVEQDDLGSGTSATSTRLIHGGLRYLEYAELGLVFESLGERERLLRHAPHLVAPLGLYLPIYAGAARKPWQIRTGMLLYDLLSLGKSLPRHRMLKPAELRARLPGLEPEGLLAGAHYYDAQVRYPERLVVELLIDACAQGAELMTYTRATGILIESGRVRGIAWRKRDGERGKAEAGTVINAAGPWVDRVLGDLEDGALIGGTQGSHLVVEPFAGAPEAAVYSEARADGRPFFVIPWNDLYLIGTTDERFNGDPGQARIEARERDYLLSETRRLFPGGGDLARRVLYTQAGVRPLPHVASAKTAAITRRHIVHAHARARGLWSVIGGKLTTHRALAEELVGKLRRRFPNLPRSSPTQARRLPGALDEPDREALLAELGAELGAGQALRLWRVYGARAREVLTRGRQAPELVAPVGTARGPLPAELVLALETEWAQTLVDLLQRRCMAGLDRDFGLETAPAVAQSLERLGIWDQARAAAELDAYRDYARRHCPLESPLPSTGSNTSVGRSPRRE